MAPLNTPTHYHRNFPEFRPFHPNKLQKLRLKNIQFIQFNGRLTGVQCTLVVLLVTNKSRYS